MSNKPVYKYKQLPKTPSGLDNTSPHEKEDNQPDCMEGRSRENIVEGENAEDDYAGNLEVRLHLTRYSTSLVQLRTSPSASVSRNNHPRHSPLRSPLPKDRPSMPIQRPDFSSPHPA